MFEVMWLEKVLFSSVFIIFMVMVFLWFGLKVVKFKCSVDCGVLGWLIMVIDGLVWVSIVLCWGLVLVCYLLKVFFIVVRIVVLLNILDIYRWLWFGIRLVVMKVVVFLVVIDVSDFCVGYNCL